MQAKQRQRAKRGAILCVDKNKKPVVYISPVRILIPLWRWKQVVPLSLSLGGRRSGGTSQRSEVTAVHLFYTEARGSLVSAVRYRGCGCHRNTIHKVTLTTDKVSHAFVIGSIENCPQMIDWKERGELRQSSVGLVWRIKTRTKACLN